MTTVNTNVCNNFTASPNDTIDFTGYTIPCSITKGDTTWPFTVASGFSLPHSSPIKIKASMVAGDYSFNVSCCEGQALKTVTVTT